MEADLVAVELGSHSGFILFPTVSSLPTEDPSNDSFDDTIITAGIRL